MVGVDGFGQPALDQQSYGNLEVDLVSQVEIPRVFGYRVAFAGDGETWVSAGRQGFTIWRDATAVTTVSHVFVDRVHFDDRAGRLYVSPHIFDLTGESLLDSSALDAALVAGIEMGALPPMSGFDVDAAAWSPDGRQLVVHARYQPPEGLGFEGTSFSGPRRRLLLLDGAPLELSHVLLEGRRTGIRSVNVNDRFVVAGARSIRVWDRASGAEVAELVGHDLAVTDLQFDGQGDTLASASYDHRVCLWNTADWSELACWEAHDGDVNALAFHPTRPLLASGGQDGAVNVWNAAAPGEALTVVRLSGSVVGLAFDPSGDRLLAACHARDARTAHFFEVVVESPAP